MHSACVCSRLTLNPGDPVLLRGHATSWGQVYEREAVIFDRCVFAK